MRVAPQGRHPIVHLRGVGCRVVRREDAPTRPRGRNITFSQGKKSQIMRYFTQKRNSEMAAAQQNKPSFVSSFVCSLSASASARGPAATQTASFSRAGAQTRRRRGQRADHGGVLLHEQTNDETNEDLFCCATAILLFLF